MTILLTHLSQIIATRPRAGRRGTGRRPTGKAQVLGTTNSPATRARVAAVTNGAKPAPTSSQPADKIIISNLPPDVNEVQIKVSNHGCTLFCYFLTFRFRSFSRLLLAPSVT